MSDVWFNDTPDNIQRCLSCDRKECVNCLEYIKRAKYNPDPDPGPGIRKPVIMCDCITGEPIERFPSINAAAKALNICHSGIQYALKGRYKTAGGFKWKLADEEET